MADITVLDSIMGSGKTTYLINMINRSHLADLRQVVTSVAGQIAKADPRKFIYIGMYLEEAERIQEACPNLDFVTPQPVAGRKLIHMNQLIAQGRNIAATHALFQNVNGDTFTQLQEDRYVLIIDETLECVSLFDDISKDDIRTLFEGEHVYVDDRKRLCWNHQRWPLYEGKFRRVRDLCDNGNLVFLDGKILIWELPTRFLEQFEQVWIATYLFEGSLMANYFKANNVSYELATVTSGHRLAPYGSIPECNVKARLRELITITDDPKLNAVGTKTGKANPLSSSWFQRTIKVNSPALEMLQRNIYTFFKHRARTPTALNMWTTFNRAKGVLRGHGYAKGFVPVNAKATNDYIERASLAYCANIFIHPIVNRYFVENGIEADEDLFALSEMIQWVWRSRIRRGERITIYIPSERMRSLFTRWLWTDRIADFKAAA